MSTKLCAIVTTICVFLELTAAQGNSNINYSRRNFILPIHRIPVPRPAPSEVQVLEVPTTTTATTKVTELPPMTTLAPIITKQNPGRFQLIAAPQPQPNWQKTLSNPQTTTTPVPIKNAEIIDISNITNDPGYFVSKEQLTGNSEVAPSTAPKTEIVPIKNAEIIDISNMTYDPGYFVSKEQLTENSEVAHSTAPKTEIVPIKNAETIDISNITYDPGYFVSKEQLTGNSEVAHSTAPKTEIESVTEKEVMTEKLTSVSTEPVSTELPVRAELPVVAELPVSSDFPDTQLPITTTELLSTTLMPASIPLTTTLSPSKPIIWNMSPSKPFLRPLRPLQQRPIIIGRSPLFDDEDTNVAKTEKIPILKPTLKPMTSNKNEHNFEVVDIATITNIAIYQGPSTIACTDANSYYPLENECESFVECRRQVAAIYMCPDGLFFNNKTVWPSYPCVYPSEVKCLGNKHEPKSSGECPRQYGFFPLPRGNDCGKYLMCQEGKATIMDCPPGLAFNPEKYSCDWPINVLSCQPNDLKGFQCPEPLPNEDGSLSDLITHFSFHDSCKQYIACQLGHPRLLSCDLGYSYDPKLTYCVRTEDVPGCNDA